MHKLFTWQPPSDRGMNVSLNLRSPEEKAYDQRLDSVADGIRNCAKQRHVRIPKRKEAQAMARLLCEAEYAFREFSEVSVSCFALIMTRSSS